MILQLFFLTLFTNDFIIVHSEYSAPLKFEEEPSDIQFLSKTSAYLHCVAVVTSSFARNNQISITWRFENGSLVKNISNVVQILSNGTLWFKPFSKLLPAVHRAKYKCVANLTLHNQAILSRSASVTGVIVKPFRVNVDDQDVYGVGGTATFTCNYPPEVSSYVQIRKWFADKQPQKTEPSGNLVIHDVQEIHSYKLYYCVVVNILTKETFASNVAKIFIRNASDARKFPLNFNLVPVNKTVILGKNVMFECLASRTRNVEYIWKHNNENIKINHRYSLVNGRSLRVTGTILKDKGKYTCVARDKISGEEISTSFYLVVQVPLAFRIRPSKICTPYYVNATFPCEVTGYPQPKIIWYKNGNEITNNKKALRQGNSLIITSPWGKDEGIYQCIASNDYETIHQAASLIVGAQAPTIKESFTAQNLSLHAKLDISCKATGKQQARLIWYRDGIRLEKSADGRTDFKHYHDLWTLQIQNVTSADSGIYRCEAMNRAGSNFSEAKILVRGPAKVTYIPENVRGLLGKDVTITCRANGFPRAQITWCDKNGCKVPYGYRQVVTTKDGESNLTIKGLIATDKGQYTCKASSNIGPSDDASVDLAVYGPPEEQYLLVVVEEGQNEKYVCHNCLKWTKNDEVVKNSARTTVTHVSEMCVLELSGILQSDAGNYTCHEQTPTGVHKQTKEIFVISRPRLVNTPNPNSIIMVLEHDKVEMICRSSGFPTPRVIWRRKIGGSFNGIRDSPRFHVTTNGSLTIVNATAEDETDYSCEIRNSHSYRADLTMKLNVNVPARIINWQATAFGNAGNMTKLSCEASGDETLEFGWLKNGQKIPTSSNGRIRVIPKFSKSTLTIWSTTRKDQGNYTCKVSNAFGKDEKTMILKIRERPDAPILKANETKTKTSITIYWSKPYFNGHSPIMSYQIDYRISSNPSGSTIVVTGEKTSYKITELEPYTRYKVNVRAKNALGMSDFSNDKYVETAEDVPSVAPYFTVTPVELPHGKQSLRVEWRLLDVKDANGVVNGYEIWYKINSSALSFRKKRVKPIDGTRASLSYLKPYTYYEIKIQAFTSAGYGPNSSTVLIRTFEGVPSTPPGNVEIKAKTSTSVSLSWTAPSNDTINGVLIGYRVSYHDNRKRYVSIDTRNNKTILTLKGLRKYTYYTITIAARTRRGSGRFSKPVNVMTNEDIPGPPKDLTAVTTSVRSIKLKWLRPEEPNGKITYYKIYYVKNIEQNLLRKDTCNIQHVEGTKTSHELENLTENQTYYFKVCAKTGKGEGNCTNVANASTSKGPPSFVDMHRGDVHLTARWKTALSLICKFSGFPIPTITWLDWPKKTPLSFGDKYRLKSEGHLVIHDLRREDSKRYVCMVRNKWGKIEKGFIVKVQVPPDPPKAIMFTGINSTAVKITWSEGFHGNSIIIGYVLKYLFETKWIELPLPHHSNHFIMNNVESGKKYSFMIKAINEIGTGNFSETKSMRFSAGAILRPVEESEVEDEMENTYAHKSILKDSAVLGTLIGVCLFIIIVIVILALLTKLGYSPGSKLAQRSVGVWRWLVAKGISANDHRRGMKRRSGGSSTDGHLGGSSSSLSQGPASNDGSTFSIPRSSSRVTESGYATSVLPIVPPLPFGNYTPGSNGGARASGSSDEGIGPETRSTIRADAGEVEYHQAYMPPRSSNGTPAPPTLMMNSREYIDPEGIEQSPVKQPRAEQHKMAEDMKRNVHRSPDISPRCKEKIYFQSLGHCVPVSPQRPKYEDGHFIIGPDVDRILAYRPPRCYDSTSSEYSSSRDELAQAYEFGKLHHLDDFYGRPTLESASSSGETANSEKDGICHFTSELSIGRPFLIPVAILPPPPNQRLRTRDRKGNPQGAPLKTYYEKDETLV